MRRAFPRTMLMCLALSPVASTAWAQSPSLYGSPSVYQHSVAARQGPVGGEYRAIEPLPAPYEHHPSAGEELAAPSYLNGAHSHGWGASSCDTGLCFPNACFQPCWYAGVGGLTMTRNFPKFGQLSFDDTNLVGQELSTHDANGGWNGGVEFTLGRYLCGGAAAVELKYWGVYPGTEEAYVDSATMVGALNTVFDFGPLNIGADNVNDLYDDAAAHRLRRSYEVHSLEANLLTGSLRNTGYSGFAMSYLAGVRWFQFNENFLYSSADTNPVFGADPATEAHYGIEVDNTLIGFQLGGRGEYRFGPRWSVYAAPKFGVYANNIEHRSRISNVNGVAVVGPGNPLVGEEFDISSNKTFTSFLGELDVGLTYQITPRWSASLGYRVVAVSGIALASDQIPGNMADLPGVADIDANNTLVMHGGYANVGFSW